MKVNAFKNIDVEFEADIEIEDVLNELADMAKDEGLQYRRMQAVDGCTRIMQRLLTDKDKDKLRQGNARHVLRERLAEWIKFLGE